jgi:nicotinic acid mononucleotide adenylyltransferase
MTLSAADLVRRFWAEYFAGKEYATRMQEQWAEQWEREADGGGVLGNISVEKGGSVGYVVGTFSPVTRAHMELARQSADEMGLAKVILVTYPFQYIPGFHTEPLDDWVRQGRHIPWEERIDLLHRAMEDEGDDRLNALEESKAWYEESVPNWRVEDRLSTFWTGTWYLMRKLQWHVKAALGEETPFVFVCGADQFNANVDALLYGEGTSDAFRDYSIAQHLAMHDVYTVARSGEEGGVLEEFSVPFGSEHGVVIGSELPNTRLCATHVRFQRLEEGRSLEDYVTPRVAARIREQRLWGYGP